MFKAITVLIAVSIFWLLIPTGMLAQEPYVDSPFALGVDPGKITPLDLSGKLKIHALRAGSPRVLATYLFVSGFDQIKNSPGEWGRGADGYGKRYASNVGRNGIREVIAFGLDGALKSDPRFYRSAKTSFSGRLGDAMLQTILVRSDSGRRVPAVAGLASAFAAGQISRIWLPTRDATFGDGAVYGASLLGSDFGRNVIREFWPDVKRKFHK